MTLTKSHNDETDYISSESTNQVFTWQKISALSLSPYMLSPQRMKKGSMPYNSCVN